LSQSSLRKVIFNQGTYLTFFRYPIEKHTYEYPYNRKDIIGTISVSEDNAQYLKYVFPHHPVYKVSLSVDTTVFSYSGNKQKAIALYPGKNTEDIRQVLNILYAKNYLNDFDLRIIKGKTEQQVAEIMQRSAIYLSFGAAESFPLMPLEAMLSGCYVIGYHGRGGKEFFKDEFCSPIEAGDIIGFARSIAEAIDLYNFHTEKIISLGKNAFDYIRVNYTLEKEKRSLLEAWQKLLG
jgi:hypothetical protein